mgnify:CR=1 FL=1
MSIDLYSASKKDLNRCAIFIVRIGGVNYLELVLYGIYDDNDKRKN